MFGDLGNENSQSIPRLQEEVQRGIYDSVLHIGIPFEQHICKTFIKFIISGDFAYDLDSVSLII